MPASLSSAPRLLRLAVMVLLSPILALSLLMLGLGSVLLLAVEGLAGAGWRPGMAFNKRGERPAV